MKVAVCLSGAVKHPEKSLESIKRIYPNEDLKVFIHTWDIKDRKVYSADSFSGKGGLSDLDILSEYNAEDILIENYNRKRLKFTRMYEEIQFHGSNRADIGIISMYYSIFKSNQLKRKYERKNKVKFDIVMRMRFDSNFNGVDLVLDPNLPGFNLNPANLKSIQIPLGNDWAGINDQFALGSSSEMDMYCNLFNNLENLTDSGYNPEQLLRTYFDKNHPRENPVHRFEFYVGINGN